MSTVTDRCIGKWNQISLFYGEEGFAFAEAEGNKMPCSSNGYRGVYATNLVSLFRRTIGENLQHNPPQAGVFFPAICFPCTELPRLHIALFGYKEGAELRGLRWGVCNVDKNENLSFAEVDAVAQDFIRHLPPIEATENPRLARDEYAKRFRVELTLAEDHRIQQIALKYQRSWYETGNNTCATALCSYLCNPHSAQAKQTLEQLGLAPEQVTAQEFAYFQQVEAMLPQMPSERAALIFANLESFYPAVFTQLLEEINNRPSAQASSNTYATTLASLQEKVVGQALATEYVAAALEAQRNNDSNRVFLFVGPTGVGKTELGKVAATFKRNRYVEFTMERYRNSESSNTLFGAAAGYVGSTDKPHFSKQIDSYAGSIDKREPDKPQRKVVDVVILFDELEKAHSNLKQSLLTLLREGHCTVTYSPGKNSREDEGKNVSLKYIFERCLFIGTSNLYQAEITRSFRAGATAQAIEAQFVELNSSRPSDHSYSPELLNRMQVVPFGPIPQGEVYQRLVQNKLPGLLAQMKTALQCQEISIPPAQLAQVLQRLETNLYGQGVGMQTIKTYFEIAIPNEIYKQAAWNPLKDKKLTLVPIGNDNQLGIKCEKMLYGKVIGESGIAPLPANRAVL